VKTRQFSGETTKAVQGETTKAAQGETKTPRFIVLWVQ
jgi:hypothetical protein